MTECILLTGGAGYIGSHTYVALVEAGYDVVILDDFSNARRSVIGRLSEIVGRDVVCMEMSVLDETALERLFESNSIRAVVHFAAKKSVSESVSKPLEYMETNIGGLVRLMRAMQSAEVFDLVFSSSATVYGDPDSLPIDESAPLSFTNPYGYTKLVGEQILAQAIEAEPRWRFGVLRYFNPVGAHPSGLIGEDPNDIPNNLMPYIAKVASGELAEIQVFGNDYPTPDGTGVRDYVHVCDLAEGHVQSLQALRSAGQGHLVNLGTGRGYSVLEMIDAYGRACGSELSYRVAPRRAGDVAACYADTRLAREMIGFEARRSLDDMCASSWHWILSQKERSEVSSLPDDA